MATLKRGTVRTADGVRGTFEFVSSSGGDELQARLSFPQVPTVLVPAELLVRGRGNTYRLPLRVEELAQAQNIAAVIPLAQEKLRVSKRQVATGGVRISKKVYKDTDLIEVPLSKEQVAIERVPIRRYVDVPTPIRQEGETTIVPLFEEAIVLEKRLLLREELIIRKRRSQVNFRKKVVRRREDVVIQDLDAGGKSRATKKQVGQKNQSGVRAGKRNLPPHHKSSL